jgi:hypothetical protein
VKQQQSPDSTEFNSMSWILRGDEANLLGAHWFVGASFRNGLPRFELSSQHDNSNKILRTMNIRPLEPNACNSNGATHFLYFSACLLDGGSVSLRRNKVGRSRTVATNRRAKMPRPLRSEIYSPSEVSILHVCQRCVRRA